MIMTAAYSCQHQSDSSEFFHSGGVWWEMTLLAQKTGLAVHHDKWKTEFCPLAALDEARLIDTWRIDEGFLDIKSFDEKNIKGTSRLIFSVLFYSFYLQEPSKQSIYRSISAGYLVLVVKYRILLKYCCIIRFILRLLAETWWWHVFIL